jgi:hypothetical protein
MDATAVANGGAAAVANGGAAAVANGGAAAVANGGAAAPCVGGAACTFTDNACRDGIYVCDDAGTQVCQDNGLKLNGSACGADRVCFAGDCIACKIGDPCSTGHECEAGTFESCGSGSSGPHCVLQGASADGTACGTTANHVCSAGLWFS